MEPKTSWFCIKGEQVKWGGAVRKIELWAKRAGLATRPRLSLCPFDSFIYPSAPWVCMICHKTRKILKGEKYEEIGVFTGGWAKWHPEEQVYTQQRAGGWIAEKFGKKPIPVAQWWPRSLVDPEKRNIEAYVKVYMHYEAKVIAADWGLPKSTVFEVDIYAGDRTSYIRADVHHPDGTKTMRITLFIP